MIDEEPVDRKTMKFIEKTVEIGSVDGVTHERIAHVDGYSNGEEAEILTALIKCVSGEN